MNAMTIENAHPGPASSLPGGGDGLLARRQGRLASHDPRAVALGGGALGRRRVARHEDRRPRAVLACGKGQRLGVVA